MIFDFLQDWGEPAKKQAQHYIQRWEKGYTFMEPATGTACWFCERESWSHDLVIPRKSLLSKIVNVWPYKLHDIIFLASGKDKEVKVDFIRVSGFRDLQELDDDYMCFMDVEVKQVHPLDALANIENIKNMLEDKSFIKHFPILVENLNNAFKKIKKTKAHK